MEELLAELGSAFLCADQITPEVREDQVRHIENWLEVLKDDKRRSSPPHRPLPRPEFISARFCTVLAATRKSRETTARTSSTDSWRWRMKSATVRSVTYWTRFRIRA
jgi:Zincin-like metallopeptidase